LFEQLTICLYIIVKKYIFACPLRGSVQSRVREVSPGVGEDLWWKRFVEKMSFEFEVEESRSDGWMVRVVMMEQVRLGE